MRSLTVSFVLRSGTRVTVELDSGDLFEIEERARTAATTPLGKGRFLLVSGSSRRFSTWIDLREVAAIEAETL